jgi:hypothetical protein
MIESADGYSCTTVEVEEFTGDGELTSFTQRSLSEQTLISPQSDEERSESSSSEEDGDEDSVAPVFRSRQLRVHCKADEFNSETIRLSPITSQTSDQQLDDVVAAIREFRAQALATAEATKAGHQGPSNTLDFQHLLAVLDGASRDDLPEYFIQSSAQTSALEVGSPFYVSPQAAGLYQPHYCAVPDDMYFYNCEDSAASSCPAQGCGYGLASYASALPSLSSQSDEERSESSVRPLYISDSEDDLPRTLFQCFRETQDRRTLEHAWAHWIEFVAESRCYSDGRSVDSESDWSSIIYDDAHDYFFPDNHLDFDSYFDCLFSCDSVPPPCTRNACQWRADCAITIEASDLEGTWELPSLAESDCAGELGLIRYTICTSAMAFENSAAAAISWERSLSLGSRLDRAHSAFQLASVRDYWENRQGYLRRRHTTRAPLAKFSTKRGRRQHWQELRRARAHRKSHRNTIPRPAQPVLQFRSPFPFAPPTAPTIPLTAFTGVFTFGAAVRSNPSAHRPANLNTGRFFFR